MGTPKLGIDYSNTRNSIPVLVKFLDGSKPLEASSIDEAGRWLYFEMPEPKVLPSTWAHRIQHILSGKIDSYRGITAEYLDPERKCKGHCVVCSRYQNLKELDGRDLCRLCFRLYSAKETPKVKALPDTARKVTVFVRGGSEVRTFESVAQCAAEYDLSRLTVTRYCNGDLSSLHRGLEFYWADNVCRDKRVKARAIRSLNDDRIWYRVADCARELGCAESSVRAVLSGKDTRVKGVSMEWFYA